MVGERLGGGEVGEASSEELVGIAVNVAKTINELAPQEDEGGVNYYFAGSLATKLMSKVDSFTEIVISDDGMEIGEERILSEDVKGSFAKFSRKLGMDIDVGVVNKDPYRVAKANGNAAPSSSTISARVVGTDKLFRGWDRVMGDKFDRVTQEQGTKEHRLVRAKMEDGSMLLLTDPRYMLANKVFESSVVDMTEQQEEDARVVYEATSRLYSREELSDALNRTFDSRGKEYEKSSGPGVRRLLRDRGRMVLTAIRKEVANRGDEG